MPQVVGCRRSHICNPIHKHPASKFWIYTLPSLPRHHHRPTGPGWQDAHRRRLALAK